MSDAEPSAWAKAMAELGAAGDRLAASMRARGDDDVAGVHATMLGVLMDVYLNQLAVQSEHPVFVPCTGYFQRLGTPNPDTMYRRAPIDPNGIYRIVGNRGTVRDATLMAFTEPSMRNWPPVELSTFATGPDGGFDVIASAERPADHDGHWLKLEPGMSCLWLRATSDRWEDEVDPSIAITRLDGHPRTQMSADWLAARLGGLATRVERTVEYGIRHFNELVDAGYVNKVKLIDYGALGAMPLQSYQEGAFELAADEALLVEARMPAESRYFSWSLTDAMFVTLDWTNAHTSINSGQAELDADGVLRVVVSQRDPGIPNWLETTGRTSGVLQCRTVGSAQAPDLKIELIPIAEVRDRLPAGTRYVSPDARREALQHRQLASQSRRLW